MARVGQRDWFGKSQSWVTIVSKPLVQIALDFPTIDEALRVAEIGIQAGVDILEAGTPLIVAEGVRAIEALVKAFPDYPVLADYKTMDSGFKNVQITHQKRGHYMTVCANAPDETVQSAISEGRRTGVKVVADTIGVKDQAARAEQCADWGVDMIYLHYGADQRRADSNRDSTQWIKEVQRAVSTPLGVGTFGVEDARRAAELGVALVAIGHPLISGEKPLEQLSEFVKQVKSIR